MTIPQAQGKGIFRQPLIAQAERRNGDIGVEKGFARCPTDKNYKNNQFYDILIKETYPSPICRGNGLIIK